MHCIIRFYKEKSSGEFSYKGCQDDSINTAMKRIQEEYPESNGFYIYEQSKTKYVKCATRYEVHTE